MGKLSFDPWPPPEWMVGAGLVWSRLDQISCLPLDAASHWSDTFYAKPRPCCSCGTTALSKGEIHPASTNQTEAKTNKTELEKTNKQKNVFNTQMAPRPWWAEQLKVYRLMGGHGVVELVAICVRGLCTCLDILENTQSSLQKKNKSTKHQVFMFCFIFFLSFIIYYYL